MTYPPPGHQGPWQPPEPPPVGDPVYVEQPYPHQPTYGGYPYPQPYGQQYAPQYGQQPYQPYGYAPQPTGPPLVAAPLIGYALIACAVLTVAAAFMPWAQSFGIAMNGTEGTGDGNLTLFHGSVIGAMGIVIVCMQGRLWTTIVAGISAGFAVIVSFKDIADVNGFANSNGLDPSAVTIGPGLWLTLLASLVAVGFAITGIARRAPRDS